MKGQGPLGERPTDSVSVERLGEGRYRSRDAQGTQRLGELCGDLLAAGDVLVLTGDLGAGKTRFTSGVARGLGDEAPVTSPTFAIMAVHDGGRIPLYHFDLYRLEDPAQLEDVGIYDVLDDDGACLVEWGDLFSDELGDERLDLIFKREEGWAGEPPRLVELRPRGTRAEELARLFDEAVCAEWGL